MIPQALFNSCLEHGILRFRKMHCCEAKNKLAGGILLFIQTYNTFSAIITLMPFSMNSS